MNAVRAELSKLRTSPGTVWLLLGIVAGTVGVSVFAAANAGCPREGCVVDPARTSLTGVQLGQIVVAVFGVLVFGSEYSTGMVSLSLAAVPRRTRLLLAKAVSLAVLVAVAGTVTVLGCLLAGRLLLPGRGYHLPPLTGPVMLRVEVGSVLYLMLVALLALGLAVTLREPAAAIGVVLALAYAFPIVSAVVTDKHWKRLLQQIQPMGAGLNIQSTLDRHDLVLGPWAGLGVLAAWTAGALLLGWLVLLRRDA